ncbi:hypothetical protein FKM82_001549 [Ascaphus truei]
MVGESPPADGGCPPADGGCPPADGGGPPADGEGPPADGGGPPADGEGPPAVGECPPVGDANTRGMCASVAPEDSRETTASAMSPPAAPEHPDSGMEVESTVDPLVETPRRGSNLGLREAPAEKEGGLEFSSQEEPGELGLRGESSGTMESVDSSITIIPARELDSFLDDTLCRHGHTKVQLALERWKDASVILQSLRVYIKANHKAKLSGTIEHTRVLKFNKVLREHVKASRGIVP